MSSPEEGRPAGIAKPGGSRWRSWLSGLLIAAALVAAVLHFGELERFALLVRQAQPGWLLAALAFQACTYFAVATGWREVLREAGQDPALLPLVRIAIAKLFADQAVPTAGMSGNVLLVDQLIALGIARGTASAALIVSIVGYYAAYALCALITLGVLWSNHEASPALASVLTVFFALALGIPALALWFSRRAGGRIAGPLRRVAWLSRMLETVAATPPALVRNRRLIVRVAACNLAVFVADAATLWVCLRGLGVDAGPWAAFVALVMASIVTTLGPIPMGLGTFEASCTAMLHMMGIATEPAFAGTMLLRVLILWLPLVPGLFLMRKVSRHRTIPDGNAEPLLRDSD